MKLNTSPRVAQNDPAMQREFREHAQQVNALSEGRIAAAYNALPSIPTAGTYAQGDFVRNSAPVEAGGFVVLGWVCVAGGDPATFEAIRSPVVTPDPWTYVVLGSDFVTSSAASVAVTGLSFVPAANLNYSVEGMFLLRTATATVGPRPGLTWPTGMTDGVISFLTTSSATANLVTNGNIGAAVLVAVGGLPNTTQSWPGSFVCTLLSGATPGGSFQINLATETAATNVTMKAGSYIRYRTI